MAQVKKIGWLSFVVALCAIAVLAIYILLGGDSSDLQFTILFTALAAGGYSLTFLAALALYEKERYRLFAALSMAISLLGFVVTVAVIWQLELIGYWRNVIVFAALAVATAHISLLLPFESRHPAVDTPILLTIVAIVSTATMVIGLTVAEFGFDESMFRLLGVFLILDVLGTIVVPLLRKIYSDKAARA